MPRFTFRFGEFEGDRNLPSPAELNSVAESKGIYGPSGDQRGSYRHHLGEDYFYMDFAKEVSEEIVTLEGEDFQQREISRARRMRFLVFTNGTYGFESRRGVYDSDAFDYLLDDDFEYSLKRYESLSLDTMRAFYKGSTRVKKLKAEDIGKFEPNPHVTDEEIRELTEDFGQHSQSVIASVGRTKESLKEADIIEHGIAKYSDLSMIKSVTPDGTLRKLRDSGRFDFGVDADKDETEKAETVRDTVSTFVRGIISNDSPDDDDD